MYTFRCYVGDAKTSEEAIERVRSAKDQGKSPTLSSIIWGTTQMDRNGNQPTVEALLSLGCQTLGKEVPLAEGMARCYAIELLYNLERKITYLRLYACLFD